MSPEAKERKKAYNRLWSKRNYVENPEAMRAKTREHNRLNPKSQDQKDQAISRTMKSHYGIDLYQYRKMLADQNGLCKICEKPPKKRRLVIDHCHKTNRVRGLLCNGCNRSLALLDNPEMLKRAIKYVESVK